MSKAVDLKEAKAIILRLLQTQGKAKNSEMIQAIGGDAALFELVREDLIFNDLAEDKKMLAWSISVLVYPPAVQPQ